MFEHISQILTDSITIKEKILKDRELLLKVDNAAEKMIDCFLNKGKVLFCGNGGSAADAQHLAGELSGRFNYDRPPLQAEALHVNTSFLTAVANDYGYDYVYARMVEAWGGAGDILVAMSTSGNSANILKAIDSARKLNMVVIGFTGAGGGKMNELCDILIDIPSSNTARVQEVHIILGHIICEMVEKILFPTNG